MRVRKLDVNGDFVFGLGAAAYEVNTPAAVAIAVETRLRLNEGEWFLDITDGTAWKTRVLGKYTQATRDAVIRERVLGTPNCTEINTYSSSFSGNTRAFAVNMTISTAFGQTQVSLPQ